MTLQDLVITPIVLLIIYMMAYLLRPWATDNYTKPYFIPALTVKIIGAIAVGLIYQFYYGGGDTFNFYYYGTRHVYAAFQESWHLGMKLILADGTYDSEIANYARRIFWFRDHSSYFVIKIASVFAFFTANTYSSIAVLFATFCFAGLWAFYQAFYYFYQTLYKQLAFAILFVPSVFFWGSGLLKDTLTLGALGFATWALVAIFFKKSNYMLAAVVLIVSFYLIYQVKIYIILCFLPAAIVWVVLDKRESIKDPVFRALLGPMMIVLALLGSYTALNLVAGEKSKYSLDNLAKTAQVTAYDIRYWTGKDAGSGYTLGELDGTIGSMLRLAPQAINVALFRPYLWEVRSPIMVLSALESAVLLLLTIWVLFRNGIFRTLRLIGQKPEILFCFVFSLIFAFAVGVSTYNFGSLVRYKIPLMPFFLIGLSLTWFYVNKERKLAELAETE